MTTILEIPTSFSVLKWAIDAAGFVPFDAEADRDRGVDAIRDYLLGMDDAEVAANHHIAVDWVANDCSGDQPELLSTLESIGHAAATEGWHRPEAAYFSVSAVL